MDVETILNLLLGYVPQAKIVLQILGTLAVAGAVYVKLTPSASDDAWYAKLESIPVVGQLLKALVAFSPISRK